jgi:hypothetical protein
MARATKIVLVFVGLLTFADASYRVVQSMIVPPRCTSGPMLNAVLATMGVFLLLAARNPAPYRTLILFAGWSSLVHAAVMAVTAIQVPDQRTVLLASVAIVGLAGALLLVFAPRKETSTASRSTP